MHYLKQIAIIFLLLSVVSIAYSQSQKNSSSRNPPRSIQLLGETFELAEQAHTAILDGGRGQYKYVLQTPSSNHLDAFENKTIELRYWRNSPANVNDTAQWVIAYLNEHKQTDPSAHHQVIEYPERGEIVVAFISSEARREGKRAIEWNTFRYIPIDNGILLYAYIWIYTGDETQTQEFLQRWEKEYQQIIDALAASPVPQFN